MDLATIHLKLRTKRYRSVGAFHGDVELLFCGRERLLHGQGPGAAASRAQLLHLAGYYRSLFLEWVVGEEGEEEDEEGWGGEAGRAARGAREEARRERLAVCGEVGVAAKEAEELLGGAVAAARFEAAAAAVGAAADSREVARRLEQLEGLCKRALAAVTVSAFAGPGAEAEGAAAAAAAVGSGEGGVVTVRELWSAVDGVPAASPVRGVLERGFHRLTAGVRERALRGSGAFYYGNKGVVMMSHVWVWVFGRGLLSPLTRWLASPIHLS